MDTAHNFGIGGSVEEQDEDGTIKKMSVTHVAVKSKVIRRPKSKTKQEVELEDAIDQLKNKFNANKPWLKEK